MQPSISVGSKQLLLFPQKCHDMVDRLRDMQFSYELFSTQLFRLWALNKTRIKMNYSMKINLIDKYLKNLEVDY